jgi:hypothetical protein
MERDGIEINPANGAEFAKRAEQGNELGRMSGSLLR